MVDLGQALHLLNRNSLPYSSAQAQSLAQTIGDPDHIIFFIVDGLGCHQLPLTRKPNGVFSSIPRFQISSVFPSATTAALNSLATGVWPCDHGLFGWWTRIPHLDTSVLPLVFLDENFQSLTEKGYTVRDLSLADSLTFRNSQFVFPRAIYHSPFSRYYAQQSKLTPYESLNQIKDSCFSHIKQHKTSFSCVYFPLVDEYSHEFGIKSDQAIETITQVDQLLTTMTDDLPPRCTLLVTADHGHINTDKERSYCIDGADPLYEHLQCAPTGEPRTPLFHVKTGHEAYFCSQFMERFGAHFIVLSPDQLEDYGLWGPHRMLATQRERMGSYVALSPYDATIEVAANAHEHQLITGIHGGLTPRELLVPLYCLTKDKGYLPK